MTVDPFDDHDSMERSGGGADAPGARDDARAVSSSHTAVVQAFDGGVAPDGEPDREEAAGRAASSSSFPGAPTAAGPDDDALASPGAGLGDATDLRRQWVATQARFVDDPESAVREADALVTDTIVQLTRAFDEQRARLEETWGGAEASTDDLRAAFQTYRDFFDRLLSA